MTVIEGIYIGRNVALLGMAVICVYTDISRGKLYNAVTVTGLLLGLATAYLLDSQVYGIPHLSRAAVSALIGGGALLIGHVAGGLAGGDYKLMAAVGALGPVRLGSLSGPAHFSVTHIVWALVFTVLAGAVIALGMAIWRGQFLRTLKGSLRSLVRFRVRKDPNHLPMTIPYGVAIGIGSIWAWVLLMLGS